MNPTVMAAAIGVSGTVVVGVAGFGAAIWNTRRTIAHARESRVWDQRADAYVDALAAVNYRQFSRQTEYMPADVVSLVKARQRAQKYLATHEPPDWSALEARLQAFASEPVFTAVQASSTAHREAMDAINLWRSLREDANAALKATEALRDAGTPKAAETLKATETDRAEVTAILGEEAERSRKAWKAAEAADDAVVELIRTELQGRGKPLGDWQPIRVPDPA